MVHGRGYPNFFEHTYPNLFAHTLPALHCNNVLQARSTTVKQIYIYIYTCVSDTPFNLVCMSRSWKLNRLYRMAQPKQC